MADELVRTNIDDYMCKHSIIRHYSDGKDVVYCLSDNPYFMMIEGGNPTSYALYLDMDTICDFEIFNDTVYFCGVKNISGVGKGVIGYFDASLLQGPNYINVHFLDFSDLKIVKALEVGNIAFRKHVVAVGDGVDFKAKMLDVIDEATYWNVNTCDLGGDTVLLSDLAITSSYVVVTSLRDTYIYPPIERGRLWYLRKPTIPGASLLSGYVEYGDINNVISGKYCIKTRRRDEFVTAFKEGMTTMNETRYYVSYHDGLLYQDKLYFTETEYFNCTHVSLRDIAIEPFTRNTEVLLSGVFCNPSVGPSQSIIYEIPYNNNWSNGSIYGHVQDGVFLTSLDVSPRYCLHSSGYSSEGFPIFDKLKNGMFDGECFEKISNKLIFDTISFGESRKLLSVSCNLQYPEIETIITKKMQIDTICVFIEGVTNEEESNE